MGIAKFPLFFFILIIFFSSSDNIIIVEAFNHIGYIPSKVAIPGFLALKFKDIRDENVANQLHSPPNKVGVSVKGRKLLETEVVQLDYDYAGPNPKHDPRKGRGGRSL